MDMQNLFDQGFSKVKGAVSSVGIEQQGFMRSFVRMCTDGWEQGWHERNGGNASYRMTPAEVQQCRTFFFSEPRPWVPLPVRAEGLAGDFFVVTGAGKHMRNVALDPSANLGIVEIDGSGSAYRIVWGLEGGARPTSEFASHFMIHAVRKQATDGGGRVLYHCHPTDVVALAAALPMDGRDVTRALWKTMTECIIVFPEGVGVVPVLTPGGTELADATARLMGSRHAVIWAHHGLCVSGDTFDDAFGLTHVIAKAAAMYRTAREMCADGVQPREITDEELQKIADDLGLQVPEGYLG